MRERARSSATSWSASLPANALPLTGICVLTLATNVPGPLAASRLLGLGASVTKIEPPTGDMLAEAVPSWYAALHTGVDVQRLDLKTAGGQTALAARLPDADLLITAQRPAALARLGLAWETLHNHYPNLCQVAIVGYPAPETERAGHDLTYQAAFGLLHPPDLPRALLADFAGAERTVAAALTLLLARLRGQGSGYAQVALSEAAAAFAAPLQYGVTAPGGWLGGGHPGYGLYRAQDGWIAVAALEPHFAQRLAAALDLPALSRPALEARFPTQTVAAWLAWAAERDLPLAAVDLPGGNPGAE
jgi:alpha-methylacyl-CoA racemase